ncbi:hypothetical protein [Nannocystis punicea]|uniref:GIY-YIG nuclease family protein n=1 Tax=Nannocystis punicea TaxID=2995304 RepID=A0ABY7GY71_9BACT|nr:hypothetical protein [Nannocystis poenicansa]WAS91920.1 hypothetical protein O0S08_37535 [Nannocystis poenicansa]
MTSWSKWHPLTEATCRLAPIYQGNYEIALASGFIEYENGKSKTLYYGKSYKGQSSVRQRITRHLAGAGSSVIADVIDLGLRLKVRWRQHDDPSDGECALFGAFVDRFGELPKANKRGCSTKKVLEQIAA